MSINRRQVMCAIGGAALAVLCPSAFARKRYVDTLWIGSFATRAEAEAALREQHNHWLARRSSRNVMRRVSRNGDFADFRLDSCGIQKSAGPRSIDVGTESMPLPPYSIRFTFSALV